MNYSIHTISALVIIMLLLLSANTSRAYYAPVFSDCLEEDSEQHDQLYACQVLIRTNAKRRDLHVMLGKLLEKRNKPQQALKAYQNALTIFPGDTYFLEKLSLTKAEPVEKKTETVKQPEPVKEIVTKTQNLQKPEKTEKPINRQKNQTKKSTDMVINTKPAEVKKEKLDPPQQKFIDKLKLLDSLKNQQIISQAEYDRRKKQLLDNTFRISTNNTAKSSTADPSIVPNSKAAKKKQLEEITKEVLREIDFGEYYALIIGNNDYKHLPKLKTAVNDAESLSSLLKEKYGFKTRLLINSNRYNTLKALGELRNTLTKKDNLLIYYAGHGVLDEASERGYWLPVDAERDFKSNWISTAEITDTLKALQSWHVLVVADSCYSGTLVRSAPVKFKNPMEKVSLIKRLHKKKSRTAITSGGLEPVADSGGDNHSVFAQAFLDVLNDSEDVIEAENIFGRLRDKVILNADQTPEYSNVRKVGHNGGDFIFRRK